MDPDAAFLFVSAQEVEGVAQRFASVRVDTLRCGGGGAFRFDLARPLTSGNHHPWG
ncbi:hypothetical protein [Niveispirillum lacus]|uniref:hypothetical protein n=1 Tax=Niveispirillum lacus TaxID=1981099 RepID=UPI003CCC0217